MTDSVLFDMHDKMTVFPPHIAVLYKNTLIYHNILGPFFLSVHLQMTETGISAGSKGRKLISS